VKKTQARASKRRKKEHGEKNEKKWEKEPERKRTEGSRTRRGQLSGGVYIFCPKGKK